MSIPEQKSFATSAACAAAYPIPAIELAAAFGALARYNLSMYGVVLAGAPNRRESMPSAQTPEPLAWNQAGWMPPFAAQFAVHTSAVMDMTLQMSAALNRLALNGYVETARHATAAIATIARSLRVTDAMMKESSPAPNDSACAVDAMAPAASQHITRKKTDSFNGPAPTGRRRRNPSR
ncbi:hypothetical protein [Paraburkholderia flagellata]|uniref:hypothetical protein n=1 Tax=Paraburkholderia flagellata TaxID=2883241 RepID=UPI001F4181E4|nr:hypothetical protein [Paraburkholderia flagellata]